MIFGKKDLIAHIALMPKNSVLGITIGYTKPSSDVFYSKYGFAIPSNRSGLSFEHFIEGSFPRLPMCKFNNAHNYLLVDHRGNIWSAMSLHDDDGIKPTELHYSTVYHNLDGWWVYLDEGTEQAVVNELMGFLTTNPTKEQINHYFYTFHQGQSVEYFMKSEIVRRLNEEFPAAKPDHQLIIDKFADALANGNKFSLTVEEDDPK